MKARAWLPGHRKSHYVVDTATEVVRCQVSASTTGGSALAVMVAPRYSPVLSYARLIAASVDSLSEWRAISRYRRRQAGYLGARAVDQCEAL
jgi:hypothetical protein